LGTGSSVNDYGPEQWETIRRNSSVGINWWVLHRFVPNYYLFEVLANWNAAHEIMIKRQEEFRNACWILKGNYCNLDHQRNFGGYDALGEAIRALPKELVDQIYVARDYPIPGDNLDRFRQSLKWMDRFGFFEHRTPFNYLAQIRGTMTSAIILGIKLGFRRIVLCGVDLNNVNYFFSKNPEEYLQRGLPLPNMGQTGKRHLTDETDGRFLRISDAVFEIRDTICEPKGIELYVGAQSSALHPELPTFTW
jgi:hypothetical protein